MTQKTINKAVTKEQIAAMYQLMKQHHNKNALKLIDLYEKLHKNEFVISFAGHFSAGKSSMINAVLGEEILPKSPIPTSANVVKINSGKGLARAYLTTGETIEFHEPYDMEIIKAYSKDKDAIKRIELNTSKPLIPAGYALMDTPGIDAADDADRIMTEGALHTVDYLFYIMDYNHVQSEVNLQFLRAVQEKAIPYAIIINQMDKHDENELSFEAFESSINRTFEQWNIQPEKIYYTSLKDPNIAHNQLEKVKSKLKSLMTGVREVEIATPLHQVMKEHKHYLIQQYQEQFGETDDSDESAAIDNEYHDIASELERLEQLPRLLEEEFLQELNQTLRNAYLMPAALRERAEQFLESQQKGFKVGLLGAKKKTEEEIDRRIEAFLTPLQESIESTVQWKLRERLAEVAEKYEIKDEASKQHIQELEIRYTKEQLLKLVKPGANLNGDYVLHYTDEIANDIKLQFKREARKIVDELLQAINKENAGKKQEYMRLKESFHEKLAEKQKRNEGHERLQQQIEQMNEILISSDFDNTGVIEIQQHIAERNAKIKEIDVSTLNWDKKENNQQREEWTEQQQNTATTSSESTLKVLDKTIQEVEGLLGFDSLIEDLKEKKTRLSNRNYTIALFGAFSAGKSSFANALIGENVLPVSPNPTTATVNRICPVTKKQPHGTVVVTLKDEKSLAEDVMQITKHFSPPQADLKGLLDWVVKQELTREKSLNQMYRAYLTAMITGYPVMEEHIGASITIELTDFATYVTDETRACYIASMDLYYDSALTRQGITLVDTPGADSVNARHTNVAFEYIKHADAILYVTYYNHALSRADRDFLTQLGRVKESFQLDKMFFIVNAADLAKNEEELQLVVSYVQEQLVKLGIRLPRLYPLSSKRSLQEKLDSSTLNAQMQAFEDRFYQFIHQDLIALTQQAAMWDISRTYHALVRLIESLNLDEKAKEDRKQDLLLKQRRLEEFIKTARSSIFLDRIHDKIEKQLFYVLERLSIRYHDMFKDFFNPATITESGSMGKVQVRKAMEELTDYIGYELLQELQAVAIRVETFMQEEAQRFYQLFVTESKQTDEIFELSNWSAPEIQTPDVARAFDKLDFSIFDKAVVTFKGTKSFFEKNEKEKTKELFFEALKPLAKEYIETNRVHFTSEYGEAWESLVTGLKGFSANAINKLVANNIEMMGTNLDKGALLEKQTMIRSIIRELGIEEV
ncbi:hypothetical protein D8M04_11315 [Oceanobacillus piezotolerans]|uniref:Dynamin N-terminal domain-containing protein n=1 Tax=Oceanobacillus piezotolerans TaxID=2448030 RepID=A0A498DCG2_9BACI|nr:dynamin family protein [Oceanobacillus piezotolerans]RLL45433.1 hypothetical protein D8M04_11315 [Oceanobacillus piezotolerans]